MRCNRCGVEFQGIFCPECGAPSTEQTVNYQSQYPTASSQNTPPNQAPTIIINNTNTNTNTNTNINKNSSVSYLSSKSKTMTLLLAIFFGIFGIHYFYVGKIGMGILYLFTAGLFGFGWIIDIFRILFGSFRDKYGLFVLK